MVGDDDRELVHKMCMVSLGGHNVGWVIIVTLYVHAGLYAYERT